MNLLSTQVPIRLEAFTSSNDGEREREGSSPKCAPGSDFHFWQDCTGCVEIAFRAQHSHSLAGLRSVSVKELANHPGAILFQLSSGVRVQHAGGSVGTAVAVTADIPTMHPARLTFFRSCVR
jgi:hypothetical protein